jgi:hypothetical protein
VDNPPEPDNFVFVAQAVLYRRISAFDIRIFPLLFIKLSVTFSRKEW